MHEFADAKGICYKDTFCIDPNEEIYLSEETANEVAIGDLVEVDVQCNQSKNITRTWVIVQMIEKEQKKFICKNPHRHWIPGFKPNALIVVTNTQMKNWAKPGLLYQKERTGIDPALNKFN